MKPPEEDIECRTPVWEPLQMLFMDSDPRDCYEDMLRVCRESPYSLHEIETIVLTEFLPALRFNLIGIAGEWRGFRKERLIARILEKHRYEKKPPYFFRKYVQEQWASLKHWIEDQHERVIASAT